MTVRFLAFTDRGLTLARRIAHTLGGDAARCGENCPLVPWTASAFDEADALVYVGAVGIAVRAIAPFVKCKTTDPAVIVVDETGQFVIPILSGHLGGANGLARQIASRCGGVAVITTATDLHGVFPVDLWAKAQNCAILEPERIKEISARLLAGETIAFASEWPISGTVPSGLISGAEGGFTVSVWRKPDSRLHLVPRIAVLGVGCKKGTPEKTIEKALFSLLEETGLCPEAVFQVCTIDRKGEEPGLLAFCADHGWPLRVFSSQALAAVPGTFTASAFVERTTGVDNVCERAAVLGSGGILVVPKRAGTGVTLAVALAPYTPDWRWQDV